MPNSKPRFSATLHLIWLLNFTVSTPGKTEKTEYTYHMYNRKSERVSENEIITKDRIYYYDATNWLNLVEDVTDFENSFNILYFYDKNGNTITKIDGSLTNQEVDFTYNSLNQLVQTSRGPPGARIILGQYDYNASGLRVRHRYSERGDVDYYYDESAVLEERNASDGSLLAHYNYADRLLSLNSGGGLQYYDHDALGSTVNLTDSDGNTIVSYTLGPWGHIRSQTGSSVNRQIFTGQEHDENTGLIYFGARYYDPDTSRFITQDLYLGDNSIPPSLHRYLYAYSNPTVYIDLFGYYSDEVNDTVIRWLKTKPAERYAEQHKKNPYGVERTGGLEFLKQFQTRLYDYAGNKNIAVENRTIEQLDEIYKAESAYMKYEVCPTAITTIFGMHGAVQASKAAKAQNKTTTKVITEEPPSGEIPAKQKALYSPVAKLSEQLTPPPLSKAVSKPIYVDKEGTAFRGLPGKGNGMPIKLPASNHKISLKLKGKGELVIPKGWKQRVLHRKGTTKKIGVEYYDPDPKSKARIAIKGSESRPGEFPNGYAQRWDKIIEPPTY